MTKWLPSMFNRDRSGALGDPFESLQQEINRVFEDFGQWTTPRLLAGTPRLDMSETDKALEIQVELPGLSEKEVEVLIEEDRLILRGHSEKEREEKQRDYHIRERSAGAFERVLRLPFAPDPAKVTAKHAKGVLTITMEKTAALKPAGTKVPIHTEA